MALAFRIIAAVLVVVAIGLAFLGFDNINEVTVGPVFVGIAAILAVFSRLAQAEYHNSQQMERLKAIHIMIRDEIDRASIVPARSREAAMATSHKDDEE